MSLTTNELGLTLENGPGDPPAGWATITPDMAREILATRNNSNRAIRKANVQTFARDMANDQWDRNGEAVQLDKDWNLLNGQNRLHACVLADKPFRTLLVVGLPPEVVDSVDTGASRTTGDLMTMKGVPYASDVASLVKIGQLYEEGIVTTAELSRQGGGSVRRSHAEDWEFYQTHPDIDSTVELYRKRAKDIGLSRGAVLYAAMRFRALSESDAELFLDGLAQHETQGPNDPRSTLLKYIARRRTELKGPAPRGPESLWVLFRTWNAWRGQQALTKLTPGYGGNIPVPM